MSRSNPNTMFRSMTTGACYVGIAIVCGWGCQKKNGTSVGGQPASGAVTFLVSGDTAGWIVPCGCTSAQSGGLLRRATLVGNSARGATTIVADVGGAAAGLSAYHRAKFEAILRGELAMQYVAHNLGESELAFGPGVLNEIMNDLSVPFISANARTATGKPICPPAIIVKRDDSQFLLIGVVDPSFATSEIQVGDPKEAILQTIESMQPTPCDGIVVLAWCPPDKLMELASQLPEVDAIVGGPTGQTLKPQKIGATIVCSATNKGKFVVQLDTSSAGWQARVVEVDETLADDPMQSANLDDFRRRLAAADFHAVTTAVGSFNATGGQGGLQYSGNESCERCHVRDSEHWATTKHAHAWQSLQPRRSHVDPYCQQCHTTGYAQSGGFQTIASSESLVNVGCESCHGPSSAHVVDPVQRTPWLARDQCLACHDRENSPNFSYDEYWSRIVHGQKIEALSSATGNKAEDQ